MNQPSRYFEMDYEVPFPGAAAPFDTSEPPMEDTSDESDEEAEPHAHDADITNVLNLARLRRSSHNDEEGVRASQRRRTR